MNAVAGISNEELETFINKRQKLKHNFCYVVYLL